MAEAVIDIDLAELEDDEERGVVEDELNQWLMLRDWCKPLWPGEREFIAWVVAQVRRFFGITDAATPLSVAHFRYDTFLLQNYDRSLGRIVYDRVMSSFHPIACQIRANNTDNRYPESCRLCVYTGGQDVVCYDEDYVCEAITSMMKLADEHSVAVIDHATDFQDAYRWQWLDEHNQRMTAPTIPAPPAPVGGVVVAAAAASAAASASASACNEVSLLVSPSAKTHQTKKGD